MLTFGSDRVRVVGEKVFLYSPISKGWNPRVPRTNTRSEHPGTAVLWDEKYFEVVSAELAEGGGVRYVLLPWREEHVFRVFDHYDAESETRRIEDFNAALKQRKHSTATRLFSVVLGHLPAPVQNRLANEYGVSATSMTLMSILPTIVLLGICAWLYVDATMKQVPSPVPLGLWLFIMAMLLDSGIRFMVVMLQSRAQGSLPGSILYSILWNLMPQRLPSPVAERGRGIFTLDPDEEVAARDAIRLRAPLFTFLTPQEQRHLAQRFGFDYREHAKAPAIIILIGALLGAITSFIEVRDTGGTSALLSMIIAGFLTIEQVVRLLALPTRPAGSVLGVLVRPFVRDYLA